MFLVAKMAWCGIPLSFTIPHPSLCSLLQRWHGVVYLCHLQFLTLLYVPCCKDDMVWYTFVIYNSSPFFMFFVAKMAWCGIPLSFTFPHPSLCSLLQRWHGVVYLCHLQFLTLLYFLVAKMAWCGIPLSFTIPHPSLCSLLQRWHGVVNLCHLQFLTRLYVPCCKDGMVW